MVTDDLQRAIGRMEGKLDQALERLSERDSNHAESIRDLDSRVVKVEKKVWLFSGGAGLASYLAYLLLGKH